MGKPTGFMEFDRELPRRRPVPVRLRDWRELYEPFDEEAARRQGARCMDCGIPFCHEGCPLGNLIPEWNDLVYRGDWSDAIERLHATNNFPEFTGRLCPAPCEGACVLGISAPPVTIKQVEVEIIDRAFDEGWVRPVVPRERTGKRVAVIGSGPAGLACAQQLARSGHDVVVFERRNAPEGSCATAYRNSRWKSACSTAASSRCDSRASSSGAGPPLASRHRRRRDTLAIDPGLERGLGAACAPDVEVLSARTLSDRFDATVLACGATRPRDLTIPGRELDGIRFAMEYLKRANLVQEGALAGSPIDANGKNVVIIGGGDTGADCLGTAHRQGARSVHQFEILPRPPEDRPSDNPWPTWPLIFRSSGAHEEGGERLYAVSTTEFVGDEHGALKALRGHEVLASTVDGRPGFESIPGSEFTMECELVLLALGFTGAESSGPVGELGLDLDPRGSVAADARWSTNLEGVFVCGDMTRGQSLIVWAIAEGRSAAASVDAWLMGTTALPAPLTPGQLALR